MRVRRSLLLSPALACALLPATAHAADRAVAIAGFEYEPSPLTVQVGDTVTWKNESFLTHTATAEGGSFDSGTLRGGESFSFKFTAPGDFKYACTIHKQMHGEVIVKGPGAGNAMPLPMPMPKPKPTPPAISPAPRPNPGASGPVRISLRLSKARLHGRRWTLVAVRTTRPGARILLELYSREHFSWRQVAHAKTGGAGTALLRISAALHLPLRVVVPGAHGEAASVSAATRS